jgi:hypothetical protein
MARNAFLFGIYRPGKAGYYYNPKAELMADEW